MILACGPLSLAQSSQLLTAVPPPKVTVHRNETVEVRVTIQVKNGYHVNSNKPNDDYLIPLRLKWEPGPLTATEVLFPKPEERNYSFSQKPVSVFTGDFQVTTRFKVEAAVPAGPGILLGKLRYQACSEDTCYRPAMIEIRLPYQAQ